MEIVDVATDNVPISLHYLQCPMSTGMLNQWIIVGALVLRNAMMSPDLKMFCG